MLEAVLDPGQAILDLLQRAVGDLGRRWPAPELPPLLDHVRLQVRQATGHGQQ